MASNSHNITGIIYRIYNSGASDKVVSIIDTQGSKITALAKGVKKQTSKKAHSIEIGNYIKASLVSGYALPLITDISLLNEHAQWKKGLETITALQFVCEIVDNFSFEENKDKHLFICYEEFLVSQPVKLKLALSYFILKVLEHTGNLPEINYYVNTGNEIVIGEGYVSDNAIGYVTRDASNSSNKISPLIYKSQRFILQNPLSKVVKLELSNELSNSMFRLHVSWLNQILGKSLKSLDLLNKFL